MKISKIVFAVIMMVLVSSIAFAGQTKHKSISVSPKIAKAMQTAERGIAFKAPGFNPAKGAQWKHYAKVGLYEKKYVRRGEGKALYLVITEKDAAPFVRIGSEYTPLFASN